MSLSPSHVLFQVSAHSVGGVFSKAPRIELSGGRQFVTVSRAPEPTDVWWDNMAASSYARRTRMLSGWLLFVALLALSVGVQLLLTWQAEQERAVRLAEDRRGTQVCALVAQCSSTLCIALNHISSHSVTCSYASAAQHKVRVPCCLMQSSRLLSATTHLRCRSTTVRGVQGSLVDSIKLRQFAILQGLVVTVVNLAIASGMEWAADFERHVTTTAFIDSVAFKLAFFYLLNSFVVPIIAVAVIVENSAQLWYAMTAPGPLKHACALCTEARRAFGSLCTCHHPNQSEDAQLWRVRFHVTVHQRL